MHATPHDQALIREWIQAANAFDTDAYLSFFARAGVLQDPSVGRTFTGLDGIREYFEAYFIGYNTQTEVVSITAGTDHLHVVVEFTGDFPERQVGGTYDLALAGGKITSLKADVI